MHAFHDLVSTSSRWHRPWKRKRARRRGAMMVLVVFLLVAFLAAAALMIGTAQMHLARAELRTATDAAAKAAAQKLADTQNPAAAIARGKEVAELNLVQGEPLLLSDSDFTFGRATEDARDGVFRFVPTETPINSIRVHGRRTAGSPSGAIPLFFGDWLGSGVFEPEQTVTATYLERDIVLVVDRSGSMEGSKFRELQDAIHVFTDTLRETPVEEQVGMASYSTDARIDVELTNDLGAIDRAIDRMRVSGLTSISGGMREGRKIIQRGRSRYFVDRTVIVMTDGNHNVGAEPRIVANQLARDGVVINAITFGADSDRQRMQEVARIGRGRYYHADDGAQLAEIYREIALTLSTLLTQ